MAKSVTFASKPRSKPDPSDLDAFVQGKEGQGGLVDASAPPKAPMKRLTFDIDAALHRRIRVSCVERGIDMAEDLRRILSEHFPPAT